VVAAPVSTTGPAGVAWGVGVAEIVKALPVGAGVGVGEPVGLVLGAGLPDGEGRGEALTLALGVPLALGLAAGFLLALGEATGSAGLSQATRTVAREIAHRAPRHWLFAITRPPLALLPGAGC